MEKISLDNINIDTQNKFWEHPGCLCPKLDNIDAHPYRSVVSGACEIHGGAEPKNFLLLMLGKLLKLMKELTELDYDDSWMYGG